MPTDDYGPKDVKPQRFATTCDTDGAIVAIEPAAVLRMQRNGWKGPRIAEFLEMEPTTLVDELNAALTHETDSVKFNTPTISDSEVLKGIRDWDEDVDGVRAA
ncbi:hypothetical protein CH289_07795 [Rhodococcus sp. RS1C4]|nr:hypothetical protein CH289_07795 [Rhodococcus sp. RS1C4]